MSSETKTPDEWAFATGQFTMGPKPRRVKQLSWQHNVAAVVHGWALHEREAQKPIELTKDDYLSAIRAIEKQMTDGSVAPYGGAVSPYRAKSDEKKPDDSLSALGELVAQAYGGAVSPYRAKSDEKKPDDSPPKLKLKPKSKKRIVRKRKSAPSSAPKKDD